MRLLAVRKMPVPQVRARSLGANLGSAMAHRGQTLLFQRHRDLALAARTVQRNGEGLRREVRDRAGATGSSPLVPSER